MASVMDYQLAQPRPRLSGPGAQTGQRGGQWKNVSRSHYAVVALGSILTLAGAWLLLTHMGGPHVSLIVSDLGLALVALVSAVAACFAASRVRGRSRAAWILLGAATFSWAAGEGIWSYYELVLAIEVPFPSPADIGYLLAIPLCAASLLTFPSAPSRTISRIRTLLDGLLAAGVILFLSWAMLLGPVYRTSSEGWLEKVIGLAYPAGDIVLIAVVLFVSRRTTRDTKTTLALLGAGVMSIAIADIGFASLTLNELYASGSFIDIFWLGGYLLLGISTLRPTPGGDVVNGASGATRFSTVLPYAGVLLTMAVALYLKFGEGSLEPFLFATLFSIFGLVGLRQVLTLLDNVALNRNLEAKVDERTAELRDAVSRLAESRRMQDQFVANSSHEFRTPLTLILGASKTLLNPALALEGSAKEMADMVQRAAKRMVRLVEDLILTSGMAAQPQVDTRPMDVSSELIQILESLDSPRRVDLEGLDHPLLCLADGDHLRVIVEHLLSNANKFAEESSRILLHAFPVSEHVCVVVEDEGPGIPDHLRERIFERFFQADGSSTRSFGGVGLGLFIARRLAEAMNGSLDLVEASNGRGAAFRLTLPSPAHQLD